MSENCKVPNFIENFEVIFYYLKHFNSNIREIFQELHRNYRNLEVIWRTSDKLHGPFKIILKKIWNNVKRNFPKKKEWFQENFTYF